MVVNADGRVVSIGSTRGSETDIEIDLPDDHEAMLNPYIFRYENGELVKDTDYQNQLIAEQQARQSAPSLDQQIDDLKRQNVDLYFTLMNNGVI